MSASNCQNDALLKQDKTIITDIDVNQFQQQNHSIIPKQIIVHGLISYLLESAQQKILQNRIVKFKRNKYGMKFAQTYAKQTVKLQLDIRNIQKPFFQQNQPNPLRSDNLIPTGTALQQKSPTKSEKTQSNLSIVNQIQRNLSIAGPTARLQSLTSAQNQSKKSPKIYEYVKLKQQDLPKLQVSFDPFIQEMRKQKEQASNIKQKNKVLQKKTNIKQLLKKDQKISYDFTGQLIKVKQSCQKSNFASKTVEGNENQNLNIKEKQLKTDSNPTNLDMNIKKDLSKRNLSKRGLDIQFSNINSLTSELQIKEGVKFIHNKATIQKKIKQSSIGQLKKSISNRKLSRNDFQRLKSLGENRSIKSKGQSPSLPTILKSETDLNQNNSIIGRSASEYKFQNLNKKIKLNSQRKKFSQRIFVQNQQLSQMLLENTYNNIEDMAKLRMPSEMIQKTGRTEQLSAMDRSNLQFIKTGSVGKISLPKITYRIPRLSQTSKQSTGMYIVEQRIKLKGKRKQNQFQRIRKHFQVKLRI